ncbi:MAG: TIGR02588 family protein [Gemmatimonadetes bacterium]|nr:TIGR02588 family protein [Gemmatimonadota bacterium]
MADQENAGAGDRREVSRWEWVAAAVSAALVLFVLGYLLFDATARPQTPPAVEVSADSVAHVGGVWRVEFVARNRGHGTAAGVVVEGELKEGDRTVETSETTLDYVPGKSKRHGGLFFRRDPGPYRLELRAFGYQRP